MVFAPYCTRDASASDDVSPVNFNGIPFSKNGSMINVAEHGWGTHVICAEELLTHGAYKVKDKIGAECKGYPLPDPAVHRCDE